MTQVILNDHCGVDAGHIALVRADQIVMKEQQTVSFLPDNHLITVPAGRWKLTLTIIGAWRNPHLEKSVYVDLDEDTEYLVGDTCYYMESGCYSKIWDKYFKDRVFDVKDSINIDTGGDGCFGTSVTLEPAADRHFPKRR